MKNLRIRPKSDYLKTASLEEIYVLAEHWKSDLEFYRDELTFLTNLIGKYFIMMTKEESIDKVQAQVKDVENLKIRVDAIIDKIKESMSHITALLENRFSHDEQKFRDDQAVLEEEFTNLIKDLHTAKKKMFKITEHVMESEKLQHLLTT